MPSLVEIGPLVWRRWWKCEKFTTMTNKFWSEKLTWTFGSGELNSSILKANYYVAGKVLKSMTYMYFPYTHTHTHTRGNAWDLIKRMDEYMYTFTTLEEECHFLLFTVYINQKMYIAQKTFIDKLCFGDWLICPSIKYTERSQTLWNYITDLT